MANKKVAEGRDLSLARPFQIIHFETQWCFTPELFRLM